MSLALPATRASMHAPLPPAMRTTLCHLYWICCCCMLRFCKSRVPVCVICKAAVTAGHTGSYDDCNQYDTTQCGFEHSDSSQASFCAVLQPSSWPALMQVCCFRTSSAPILLKSAISCLALPCPACPALFMLSLLCPPYTTYHKCCSLFGTLAGRLSCR